MRVAQLTYENKKPFFFRKKISNGRINLFLCHIITQKQNSFKQPEERLRIQKIEEYRGEISILDEMSKGVKVKSIRARKIKRKYGMT